MSSFNESDHPRSVIGTFDHKHLAAPDIILRDSLPVRGLSEEELIELAVNDIGEGIRPHVEQLFNGCQSAGGRELIRQQMDVQYNHESPFVRDPRGSYYQREVDSFDADELASLGYTSLDSITASGLGTNFVRVNQITPDRLDFIADNPGCLNNPSDWEREAIFSAPVDDLQRAMPSLTASRIDRYRALASVNDSAKAQRIDEALAAGLTRRQHIEATEFPVELLAGINGQLSESEKRSPWTALDYAKRGITGDLLKKYGSKVCSNHTGASLESTTIPEKILRSLTSGSLRYPMSDMEKLYAAGYTSGKDLKGMSALLNTSSHTDLIEAKKVGVSAASVEKLRKAHGADSTITVEDLKAVKELNGRGITEYEHLEPYLKAMYRPSSLAAQRGSSAFVAFANMVKTGITPERFAELTRAGIPADRVHEFAGSTHEWEDGKQFRDRIESDWALAAAWFNKQPQKWEFDKDTFRGDA